LHKASIIRSYKFAEPKSWSNFSQFLRGPLLHPIEPTIFGPPPPIAHRADCFGSALVTVGKWVVIRTVINAEGLIAMANSHLRGRPSCLHANGVRPSPPLALSGRTTEAKLGFKAHPHMLRHAYGFALANKGHDTRALQAYLGHKNIQHTVRYTELAPDRFKDFWH
jgi:hypothetical protein